MLTAHAAGGRLVVSPPEVYGGAELETLLRTERVTHAVITPSALATMEPTDLTDLRVLSVAGEAATPELIDEVGRGQADGEPVRPHRIQHLGDRPRRAGRRASR